MRVRSRLPRCVLGLVLVFCSFTIIHADLTPADVYLDAADRLAREWRYADAFALYALAERVTEGPQRLRAGLGVATSAIRLAEFDVAYSKASQLRRAFPGDHQAISVYGQAAWSNGMFEEADSAFRDVLALNPADIPARLGAARLLAARNRLPEALENTLAVIAAAPAEADAYAVAGTIYRRMRQLDQAVASLSRFYNLVPARETDRRTWTQGEIVLLKSFGRRVPGDMPPGALATPLAVPIDIVHDKVILRTQVNGRERLDFVVDTGAEQTVLSETAARRLGVTPVSRTISAGVGDIGLRGLQTGVIDALQIGPLLIRNVPCLIKTPALQGMPVGESESFSPLALGLSMRIDYKRRQLVLARALDAEPGESSMPLWFARLATVRGVINGNRPASFIVDTGGEVVSISLDTAQALSPQPAGRRIPLQVFGTSGWDRDAFLMPGVTLAFDDLGLQNASVVVLNLRAPSVLLGYRVGGTVGHRFLSKYRVRFDLQRSVLGLSLN